METSIVEQASWIAGIISAAVAVLGLAYGWKKNKNLPPVEGQRINKNRESSWENNNKIGDISGSNTINISNTQYITNNNTTSSTEEIDIPGKWNLDIGKEISLKHLKSHAWKIDQPEHEFVNKFSLIYPENSGIVLVYATIPNGDRCHASAPHLSFFEYEKCAGGWKLETTEIDACVAGSWGSPPHLNIEVIAKNKYCVMTFDGYTAQGWSNSTVSFLTKIDDRFEEVLTIISSQSDPNGNGWESDIKLEPTNTGLYAIKVSRKPSTPESELKILDEFNRELIADTVEDGLKIRPHETYKFDGTRYIRLSSPLASAIQT